MWRAVWKQLTYRRRIIRPRSAGTLSLQCFCAAEEDLREFVRVIADSQRLLIAADGLSSPLGLDLAIWLLSSGRPTEYISDTIGQQIAAKQLGPPQRAWSSRGPAPTVYYSKS